MIDSVLSRMRLIYYQYEVTFSPYVMTPGEKFVLNTIVVIFLSLLAFGFFTLLPHYLMRALVQVCWLYTGSSEGQSQRLVLNSTTSKWNMIIPHSVH